MELFRRICIVSIGVVSIFQWKLVIERSVAAVWAWYKFVDYSGGGHIVVGQVAQVAFMLGSGFISIVGYFLHKSELKASGSRCWRYFAKVVWLSVALCTLIWLVVLASPLTRFDTN